MSAFEFNNKTACAVLIYRQMSELYDRIEKQTWMSVEQRDTLLNSLAVIIAQFEGIARWTVGEVTDG